MEVRRRYEAIDASSSREKAAELCRWLRDYTGRRVNSRLIDERRCIPPNVVLDFGNQGVFGMHVEPAWGGLGLRCQDFASVLQQAASLDLGLGTWMLTSMFPGVRPIAAFGCDALKEVLLPDLAAGRVLAGYGQTEPTAGTHFPAMSASARVTADGTWRVSGDKVWIGNAAWAGVLTVMAHEIDGERRRGLNAFAVPLDEPGVYFGREMLSLGMRGMVQSEISFRDVEVGEVSLLGGRGMGLEVGVDSMSFSRFAIAATCVGAMKHCASEMARFASRRSIATGRLIEHPVFQAGFGETVLRVQAAEAVLDECGDLLDTAGSAPVEIFAVAKVAGSEFLWASADRLVQALGSRGYDEANRAPQLLRDARVTRIFEGTSEALLAYLGQQALSPRSELHTLLRETLQAPAVADAVAECVTTVKARTGLATGDDAPPPVPRTWQLAELGQVAMWATLLAAVGHRRGVDERVQLWVRAGFDEATARATGGSSSELAIWSVAEVEKWAAVYADEMGAVRQTLPGGKEEFDPLLHPSPADDAD